MRAFVFLDRDGTLVRDAGYPHRIADYARLPGVSEGLRQLQAAGYGLAIVTNQSGIGRGYFSESDFWTFQNHLVQDLGREGITIERTFFCPHHPDAGCGCRKPEPALLHRARAELGADLTKSWVIGDTFRDAALAERSRCRGAILVGRAEASGETPRVADLAEAARWILRAASPPDGPRSAVA
ncbi:MAG: HAD family hydrolase [Proteobacteria bacterium]|nr:HAD family hydrolase [Pseudomonadota bacterium]